MNNVISDGIKEKKTRNSTIESLRIVAILLIIISHYSIHGSIDVTSFSDGNQLILSFLQSTIQGNLGVDLFILISGYYLVTSQLNYKKVILLLCEVWFYSLSIYLVFCSLGLIDFFYGDFIVALFPTCYGEYWFFTVYFLILCSSPFVNAGLRSVPQRTFRNGLILFIVIWSIIPTITSLIGLFFPPVYQATLYSNPFLQLLLMYCIGAYIRLYKPNAINRRNGIALFICPIIVLVSSVVLINTLMPLGYISVYQPNVLFERLSPMTILCACGLFSIFIDSRETHVQFINMIASCVFGVYLIHDNPLMRDLVWGRIFDNSIVTGNLLIIHMAISVLFVFLACVLIEGVRKKLIEYPFEKLLNFIEKALTNNRS